MWISLVPVLQKRVFLQKSVCSIFEIAAERLRRAGAKIEQTQQEKPQEKSTLEILALKFLH